MGQNERIVFVQKFSLIIFLMLLVTACEKEIIEDTPKETPYYLGYFEGCLNNTSVSISNKSGYSKNVDRGGYATVGADLSASYWTVPFWSLSGPLGYCSLKLLLLPLREGEFLIDQGYHRGVKPYSTIRIIENSGKKAYLPLKTPFRVQVDSIRFKKESVLPYIEGKMEGILYNVEDLNDSIVIKDAVFGYH